MKKQKGVSYGQRDHPQKFRPPYRRKMGTMAKRKGERSFFRREGNKSSTVEEKKERRRNYWQEKGRKSLDKNGNNRKIHQAKGGLIGTKRKEMRNKDETH